MSTSSEKVAVIPTTAKWLAGIVSLGFAALGVFLEYRDPTIPLAAKVLAPIALFAVLFGVILLFGYIYGDAKRRGMRYVLWTLLAIFVPNAVGILLYFVLRSPLPVACPSCDATVSPSHPYCPYCGGVVQPQKLSHFYCPQCGKAIEADWKNCAHCGSTIASPVSRSA